MLLIDELAETQLLKQLAAYRTQQEDAAYIYFAVKEEWDFVSFQKRVLDATRQYQSDIATQVYVMAARTICVLSPSLSSVSVNNIIDTIAEAMHLEPDLDWVVAQKLQYEHYGLMNVIKAQYELQKDAQEALIKRRKQAQSEARRTAILAQGSNAYTETIAERRTLRTAPKIMMIEDDDFSRQLVKKVLKKQYDVTALSDAAHALDTYVSVAPDVLLLDINLPDVTGHELLERIMQMDSDAYVVMLSGSADMTNIQQAMGRGAKGFIGKPFSKDRLFQYIHQCPTIIPVTA